MITQKETFKAEAPTFFLTSHGMIMRAALQGLSHRIENRDNDKSITITPDEMLALLWVTTLLEDLNEVMTRYSRSWLG